MLDATQGRRRGKRGFAGFTLAEILVALTLIALLAAVLLPTVAGQILKGDASRVMQDLNAVRSGVEQFLADVHRYPGKYADLAQPITTAGTDINNQPYTAGLVAKWAGPYVTKDLNGTVVQTGFGGDIQNGFFKTLTTAPINYLTVVVWGITGPDFDKIDLQIDGTGVLPRTTGLLRWGSALTVDTTRFLAIPIQ